MYGDVMSQFFVPQFSELETYFPSKPSNDACKGYQANPPRKLVEEKVKGFPPHQVCCQTKGYHPHQVCYQPDQVYYRPY
jgi:hypothetical protein